MKGEQWSAVEFGPLNAFHSHHHQGTPWGLPGGPAVKTPASDARGVGWSPETPRAGQAQEKGLKPTVSSPSRCHQFLVDDINITTELRDFKTMYKFKCRSCRIWIDYASSLQTLPPSSG